MTSDSVSGQTTTRLLDQIQLAAGQSMQLDMSKYFSSATPLPSGYAQLSVSYQGAYADLLFDAGSADQSGTYVFQVTPSGEATTTGKIFCYWSVDGDTSTMISVWNYSSAAQDMTLTLYFSGGQYRIPIHLEARKSYNLDMMTLVKSRVPDADGNLIPSYIGSGSEMLVGPSGSELEPMNLVVSTSAYNVRNGTCWPICINCGGLTSLTVSPEAMNITVGNDAGTFTATFTMSSGGSETLSYGDWSSNNTSIATVNSNGTVNGTGPGTTSLLVQLSEPPGGVTCYNSDPVCGYQTYSASGTATVAADQTPVIASIQSDVWNAGTTTSVTITGQYFGSNTPTLTFSDSTISYLVMSNSDEQIVANVTVLPGTRSETVSVTVTNNGYGGNAFNGGGSGGESATSTPAQAAVQGPPTAAGISPSAGLVGTPISVTITGTGFAAGATVNAGSNISVSNVSVASSTQITATFTPSNSKSAGGNQGVAVTVSGQTSNSQNFFVQYPSHLGYANETGTPYNGHSAVTSGTDINITYYNGAVEQPGVCGGYIWLTYIVQDQSGKQITNGTAAVAESFSNFLPSPYPFQQPTPKTVSGMNLGVNFLTDIQAVWDTSPPACLGAYLSGSFNQAFTATVGTVNYPLTTVVTVAESTNIQGVPTTFNVSITTP
jgi:hypothetical protein